MATMDQPSSSVDDLSYPQPDPNAPGSYLREIYSSFRKPAFSTDSSEWERLARLKVPASNFGYVYGSAGSGETYQANRQAFNRYRLKPQMLVDATRRDLHVDLFGTPYPTPFLAAPIGVQSIMHPDAEEATARACRSLDIPMVLSTAATRTIEQVASANGPEGHRWFQLYWPRPADEEITLSILKRARENGFTVLVVTLDTFLLGWRPTDLDNTYLPFLWGQGCEIGHSDPTFLSRFQSNQLSDERSRIQKLQEAYALVKRPGTLYGALKLLSNASTLRRSLSWLQVMNSGTYRTWSHLSFLRSHWTGPIVLKGIQTVPDAHLAIEHNMDGIIISNHGGRQVDGAIASLDALANIAADPKVKDSGITLMFDSGIRTGSDALKAIALGAKAVLIGRPYVYGLAFGGEDGVRHVFRCLLAELDVTMGNIGKKSLEDLGVEDLEGRGCCGCIQAKL